MPYQAVLHWFLQLSVPPHKLWYFRFRTNQPYNSKRYG